MSPRHRLELWHAPLGVLCAICLLAVAGGIIGLTLNTGAEGPYRTNVTSVLAQDLIFAAVAIGFSRIATAPLARMGLARTSSRWLLVAPLAALAAFYAIAALWSTIFGDGQQSTLEQLGVERAATYVVAAGILTVLLAPVAEELFFRGFLLESFRARMPDWAAVTAVSALFGAVHYTGPDTLVLLVPLALLSVLLCVLRLRSGSLWPAIVLHAANNAVAFSATAPAPAPWVALGAAVLLIGTIVLVARRPGRTMHANVASTR